MKVLRTGRFRNAGTDIIADTDVSKLKAGKYTKHWKTTTSELSIPLTGEDRGNSYRYQIKVQAMELFRLIELGIEEYATTKAERALGYSALTTLKELFTDYEDDKV